MNNTELIAAAAASSKVSQKDVRAAFVALSAVLVDKLQRGEPVAVSGLGIFKVRLQAARAGVNPRTKAPIFTPAKAVPVLTMAKKFKSLQGEK